MPTSTRSQQADQERQRMQEELEQARRHIDELQIRVGQIIEQQSANPSVVPSMSPTSEQTNARPPTAEAANPHGRVPLSTSYDPNVHSEPPATQNVSQQLPIAASSSVPLLPRCYSASQVPSLRLGTPAFSYSEWNTPDRQPRPPVPGPSHGGFHRPTTSAPSVAASPAASASDAGRTSVEASPAVSHHSAQAHQQTPVQSVDETSPLFQVPTQREQLLMNQIQQLQEQMA